MLNKLKLEQQSIKEIGLPAIKQVVDSLQKEISAEGCGLEAIIVFVKEFGSFAKSLEELFSKNQQADQASIDQQFREVKQVKTGVTITFEQLEELKTTDAKEYLSMQKKVSDSQKFSAGSKVLKLSEHDQSLAGVWEEFLNVQKNKN